MIMDDTIEYLKQLNLSEIEAKLYLTLLENGPTSVRELAQIIEIKRTTAYFYIDQLVEKELILKLVRGSKKLVAANDPENLQTLVEEKLKHAKSVQQSFPDILSSLKNSLPQGNNTGDAEILYLKGKGNIKKIYAEAFKSSELRLYANLAEIATVFENEIVPFKDALENNKNLKIFEIVADNPNSVKQFELEETDKSGRYKYKFMPLKVGLNAAFILLYDNNVAIINMKDVVSSIVLHNSDYYTNSKKLFDFIWSILPDPER